jgi:hypothetical protein
MAFEFALAAGLRARSPVVLGRFASPDLALFQIGSLSTSQREALRLQELSSRTQDAWGMLSAAGAGPLTYEAAKACHRLARIGAFARSSSFFLDQIEERRHLLLQEPSSEDVAELQALDAITPWNHLLLGAVHINPSFPLISHTLGGADADFVSNDVLFEVKTGATARFSPADVRQAVALTALAKVVGIDGSPAGRVSRVGFLLARSGLAVHHPLSDFLTPGAEERLVEVLVQAASQRTSR